MSPDTLATVELLKRNLRFRVQLSAKEASDAVRLYVRTGQFPYNEIPWDIAQIFGEIMKACGVVVYPDVNGRPNPNTGGTPHVNISIGNEGSFVIYVMIVKAYPANKPRAEIVAELQAVGAKFKADENTVKDENGSFTLRLWWD